MSHKPLAVLCVHGIQGSPRQFEWLLRALPEDIRSVNLTLPGHGGGVREFRQSSMAQWQKAVDDALIALSAQYDVLFVGHSMGCLLGIDACARRVGSVRALALLACPLRIRPTWRYLRNNFLAVLGRRLEDPFVAAAREMNGVQADHPAAYLSCARQYLQLLMKIRGTRALLPRIAAPMLAFQSEWDEIVSAASLRAFESLPNARAHIAKGSGHYLYSESAQAEILDSILKLFHEI